MKQSIILVAVIISILTSCNKEKLVDVRELNAKSDAKIINGIDQSEDPGIPFPDGSKAFKEDDGSFKIILPEGMKYIVKILKQVNFLLPLSLVLLVTARRVLVVHR